MLARETDERNEETKKDSDDEGRRTRGPANKRQTPKIGEPSMNLQTRKGLIGSENSRWLEVVDLWLTTSRKEFNEIPIPWIRYDSVKLSSSRNGQHVIVICLLYLPSLQSPTTLFKLNSSQQKLTWTQILIHIDSVLAFHIIVRNPILTLSILFATIVIS